MTDLTLDEALAEVRKYGRMVKGFEKVLEVADALSGANQLIAERGVQAGILASQVESTQAALATAQQDLVGTRQSASDLVATAKAEAQTIVAQAQAAAEQTRSEALAYAADQRAQVSGSTQAVDAKQAELAAAEKALADVKARTAAALEQARKTFGG